MQKHKREENKGQTPPNSQTTKTELELHTKPDPVKKPSKQQLAFDELSNENKILRMRVKVKEDSIKFLRHLLSRQDAALEERSRIINDQRWLVNWYVRKNGKHLLQLHPSHKN